MVIREIQFANANWLEMVCECLTKVNWMLQLIEIQPTHLSSAMSLPRRAQQYCLGRIGERAFSWIRFMEGPVSAENCTYVSTRIDLPRWDETNTFSEAPSVISHPNEVGHVAADQLGTSQLVAGVKSIVDCTHNVYYLIIHFWF
jgi:hypothetical protein